MSTLCLYDIYPFKEYRKSSTSIPGVELSSSSSSEAFSEKSPPPADPLTLLGYSAADLVGSADSTQHSNQLYAGSHLFNDESSSGGMPTLHPVTPSIYSEPKRKSSSVPAFDYEAKGASRTIPSAEAENVLLHKASSCDSVNSCSLHPSSVHSASHVSSSSHSEKAKTSGNPMHLHSALESLSPNHLLPACGEKSTIKNVAAKECDREFSRDLKRAQREGKIKLSCYEQDFFPPRVVMNHMLEPSTLLAFYWNEKSSANIITSCGGRVCIPDPSEALAELSSSVLHGFPSPLYSIPMYGLGSCGWAGGISSFTVRIEFDHQCKTQQLRSGFMSRAVGIGVATTHFSPVHLHHHPDVMLLWADGTLSSPKEGTRGENGWKQHDKVKELSRVPYAHPFQIPFELTTVVDHNRKEIRYMVDDLWLGEAFQFEPSFVGFLTPLVVFNMEGLMATISRVSIKQ